MLFRSKRVAVSGFPLNTKGFPLYVTGVDILIMMRKTALCGLKARVL